MIHQFFSLVSSTHPGEASDLLTSPPIRVHVTERLHTSNAVAVMIGSTADLTRIVGNVEAIMYTTPLVFTCITSSGSNSRCRVLIVQYSYRKCNYPSLVQVLHTRDISLVLFETLAILMHKPETSIPDQCKRRPVEWTRPVQLINRHLQQKEQKFRIRHKVSRSAAINLRRSPTFQHPI